MLDPYILMQALDKSKLSNLKWRFDLPEFGYSKDCLTLATFNDNKVMSLFE